MSWLNGIDPRDPEYEEPAEKPEPEDREEYDPWPDYDGPYNYCPPWE